MEETAGHIVKAKDIKLEGQIHLDVAQSVQTSPKQTNIATTVPQVHIVENNPGFAVLEVTCSCGAKTHLRCEYADAQSGSQES